MSATIATETRNGGSLERLVMRWARLEMAVRMASVGGTDAGDEMSDDAETAKLKVLQAALPGKWRQWKKAHISPMSTNQPTNTSP